MGYCSARLLISRKMKTDHSLSLFVLSTSNLSSHLGVFVDVAAVVFQLLASCDILWGVTDNIDLKKKKKEFRAEVLER